MIADEFLRDESGLYGFADYVFQPQSLSQLRLLIQDLAARKIPFTCQGGKTGITGGSVPEGGAVINLSSLKEISLNNGLLTCQAGVSLAEINAFCKRHGIFFPPNPTETDASIGGMVATNASGSYSFYYGAIRNYVASLTLVLADGEVLHLQRGEILRKRDSFYFVSRQGTNYSLSLPTFSSPHLKNAAAYFLQPEMDLLDLFIGQEGTLGIIFEVGLKTIPSPAVTTGALFFFANQEQAFLFAEKGKARAVACEYFDRHSLHLLLSNPENPLPAQYAEKFGVYLEWHSQNENSAEEALWQAADLATEFGVNETDILIAESRQMLEKIRQMRHFIPEGINREIARIKNKYPAITKLGTDFCLPREHFMRHITFMQNDTGAFTCYLFGHLGDYHLHYNLVPQNREQYEDGKKLILNWAKKAVALGGTVSGEHGIGKLKKPLLKVMYSPSRLTALKAIKEELDPQNLLGRGNLF